MCLPLYLISNIIVFDRHMALSINILLINNIFKDCTIVFYLTSTINKIFFN